MSIVASISIEPLEQYISAHFLSTYTSERTNGLKREGSTTTRAEASNFTQCNGNARYCSHIPVRLSLNRIHPIINSIVPLASLHQSRPRRNGVQLTRLPGPMHNTNPQWEMPRLATSSPNFPPRRKEWNISASKVRQ